MPANSKPETRNSKQILSAETAVTLAIFVALLCAACFGWLCGRGYL